MGNVLLCIYGGSAGLLIAGSFLAFLSMIGVIPRLAGLTRTIGHAGKYEMLIFFGGIAGTIVDIFRIPIGFGYWFLILFGFFGGVFIGCLIGALAEILKSLPIFSRRIKLRDGIPYIIWAIALGKSAGCFLQFFAG